MSTAKFAAVHDAAAISYSIGLQLSPARLNKRLSRKGGGEGEEIREGVTAERGRKVGCQGHGTPEGLRSSQGAQPPKHRTSKLEIMQLGPPSEMEKRKGRSGAPGGVQAPTCGRTPGVGGGRCPGTTRRGRAQTAHLLSSKGAGAAVARCCTNPHSGERLPGKDTGEAGFHRPSPGTPRSVLLTPAAGHHPLVRDAP